MKKDDGKSLPDRKGEAQKPKQKRPEQPMGQVIKKYLDNHFHFNEVFRHPDTDVTHHPTKKPVSPLFRLMVQLLKISPWIVGAGFVLSFFLDFGPEHFLPVFGAKIPLESLLRIVTVSGLIGFFTNWLAIRMLFKPVERRPIWGQGLIPSQRDIIIAQLANGIHKNILSEELIAQRIESSGILNRLNKLLVKGTTNLLHDPEFREEVKSFVYWLLKDYLDREDVRKALTEKIDEKLESKLRHGVKGFLFRTYRKLNPQDYQMVLEGLIKNIPESSVEGIEELEKRTEYLGKFLEEKEEEIEQFFTRLVMDVLERIDIYELLKTQMAHFDEAKLERMIYTSTSSQLLYIQYLGTVLGMLGGLLIWQPIPVLITYAALFSLLYISDIILYRLKNK